MHGIGAGGAGGVNMAQQGGRPGGLREQDAIRAAGLEQEELILSPGDNPKAHRVPAASFGSKGNVVGVEGTLAGQHALRELHGELKGAEQRDLILEPTDKALLKSVHGGASMRNKAAQVTRKEEAVEAEIRNSQEVLKLEPTTADKHTRRNPVLAASMSGKQIVRESRHEALLEADNRRSAATLDLDPVDSASRFRVTGGTSMGNKTTRIAASAEVKAFNDFNLTSTEELRIDPNINATRVSIPSAAALANKTERIRSSKQDLREAELRLEQEELHLEPKPAATSTSRRVKNTSALSSSALRFSTQQEADAEQDAQRDAEPEVLLLDPSDKNIRKAPSAAGFPKSRTGRDGAVKKEPAPAPATAKAATASRSSLGGTGTSGSAKGSRPAGGSSTKGSTISANKSKEATALKAGKGAVRGAEEPPSTPVITVPQLGDVAPRAPKGKAVYENLSPNEVMSMIDMQSKLQDMKM
jgi:hypothetical protein